MTEFDAWAQTDPSRKIKTKIAADNYLSIRLPRSGTCYLLGRQFTLITEIDSDYCNSLLHVDPEAFSGVDLLHEYKPLGIYICLGLILTHGWKINHPAGISPGPDGYHLVQIRPEYVFRCTFLS